MVLTEDQDILLSQPSPPGGKKAVWNFSRPSPNRLFDTGFVAKLELPQVTLFLSSHSHERGLVIGILVFVTVGYVSIGTGWYDSAGISGFPFCIEYSVLRVAFWLEASLIGRTQT